MDLDSESERSLFHADSTDGVLREIALKCGTKVSGNMCLQDNIRWHHYMDCYPSVPFKVSVALI